jgi:hypothetical protein
MKPQAATFSHSELLTVPLPSVFQPQLLMLLVRVTSKTEDQHQTSIHMLLVHLSLIQVSLLKHKQAQCSLISLNGKTGVKQQASRKLIEKQEFEFKNVILKFKV